MSNDVRQADTRSATIEGRRSAVDRPRLDVDTLMNGRRDVVLVHNGNDYVLRITSNGKLILTK
jgi:hemin uptake protein HemP